MKSSEGKGIKEKLTEGFPGSKTIRKILSKLVFNDVPDNYISEEMCTCADNRPVDSDCPVHGINAVWMNADCGCKVLGNPEVGFTIINSPNCKVHG